MKHTISEMKNTLDGINTRLGNAEKNKWIWNYPEWKAQEKRES